MKKLLLLILTLVTLVVNAQTSVYHAFPDSNAIWNVGHSIAGGPYGLESFYYSYTISGDTTIVATTYHKIWVPAVVHTTQHSPTEVFPGYYAGSIRQDTIIRKVFFVPHD